MVKSVDKESGGKRLPPDGEGRSDRGAPGSSPTSATSRRSREKDPTPTGTSGREKSDRENRDRRFRDEPKRLRNEGESRTSGGPSKSDLSGSSSRKSGSVGSDIKLSPTKASTPLDQPVEAKDDGDAPINITSTVGKKEFYEALVEYENNEARAINVEEIVARGHDICKNVERNLQEMLSFVSDPPKDPEEFEYKLEDGLLMISDLREINRNLKLKLKFVKEDQLNVRTEVDADHLLLQNLLYEATHLQNQVAVQDYKGIDENIDLIPVEQFYAEAPESISKKEITQKEPHLLRIARLEYEYIQRQQLTDDCSALEKVKNVAAKTIEDTQSKLDNIVPLLDNVLAATDPVLQFFGTDMAAKREQQEVREYLPPELFVLYVQSNAYGEANGNKKDFVVKLCGNVEEAKELVVTPEEVEEESDSDKEQEPELETSRRRLMKKKSSFYLSPEEQMKKLIQKHPLWIEWIVHAKGANAVLIQFFYLIKLKVVTVKVKTFDDSVKLPEGRLTSSDNMLDELFPNDFGDESPNPANNHLFKKLDAKGLQDFIAETGKPYLWSQTLAGVEFPLLQEYERGQEICVQPKMGISSMSIGKVLKAIKNRLYSQIILFDQLKLLENRTIQIPPAAKDLFSTTVSTAFKSWEPITYSQYTSYSFSREHVRRELVSAKNIFYKATLERGRATGTALISLSRDFPTTPPLFCIQLEKDGKRRKAKNDPAILDVEKEVNIYCIKEFQPWAEILLSLQLMKLLQCFDIILETDFILGESAGPSEFGREKLFLHASTGRNLRRPLKYCGTGGGYFSHRY